MSGYARDLEEKSKSGDRRKRASGRMTVHKQEENKERE